MYTYLNYFTFCLCLLLLSINQSNAQRVRAHSDTCGNIPFQKVYPVGLGTRPSSIISTKDGGYLVSGMQIADEASTEGGLLLKVSKYGDKEWIKGYKKLTEDNFSPTYTFGSSTQLSDSSYITTATMIDGAAALQKNDKNGLLIWKKSFRTNRGTISFSKVIAVDDNSFIITGTLGIVAGFQSNGFVIKYDGSGNIIWQKEFDNGNGLCNTYGVSKNGDTLTVDGIITTTNPSIADTAFVMTMAITDGTFYKARKTWYLDAAITSSNYLKRLDGAYLHIIDFSDRITGELLSHIINLSDAEFTSIRSVEVTGLPNGYQNTATSGEGNECTVSFGNVVDNISYLMRFNDRLEPVFAKFYPQFYKGNNQYYFTSLVAEMDSGIVVAGYRTFGDSSAIYLVRTDANGETGSCSSLSITPVSSATEVNSELFSWTSYLNDLQIFEEAITLSELIPNNSDSSFCSSSNCNNGCNFLSTITSVPVQNIYTGGDPKVIYIGYGSQKTNLKVTANGEFPFMYRWEGNGELSCSDCSSPLFTPTMPGIYKFKVFITDSRRCTSIDSIVICVVDIRVSNSKGKNVYLCHVPSNDSQKSITLTLSASAVSAHLVNHPKDRLGTCNLVLCNTENVRLDNTSTQKRGIALTVSIFPNPSTASFSIYVESRNNLPISIILRNTSGAVVYANGNVTPNTLIKIKSQLPAGIYYSEIIQGEERIVKKLLKIN